VLSPSRIGRSFVPKTVLIADNSEMVRKLLCQHFENEADYDLCAEAKNGEEAIALALKHEPDLIVLDLLMPAMNGLVAARQLKQLMPEVPIILFTDHGDILPYMGNCPADLVLPKQDLVVLMNHIRALAPA
jgi:DNA-binding NarL/FixJ family response regulator